MTDRGERAEMTPREAMDLALAKGATWKTAEGLDAIFDELARLGFALVPLEPTGDMERAGKSATGALRIYRAMLAARPK